MYTTLPFSRNMSHFCCGFNWFWVIEQTPLSCATDLAPVEIRLHKHLRPACAVALLEDADSHLVVVGLASTLIQGQDNIWVLGNVPALRQVLKRDRVNSAPGAVDLPGRQDRHTKRHTNGAHLLLDLPVDEPHLPALVTARAVRHHQLQVVHDHEINVDPLATHLPDQALDVGRRDAGIVVGPVLDPDPAAGIADLTPGSSHDLWTFG